MQDRVPPSDAVFQDVPTSEYPVSDVVFNPQESMVTDLPGEPDGLYRQRVLIACGAVLIDNAQFDCAFDVPFDDDTEANEATITVYNLADTTVNQFMQDNVIAISAGYGDDIGIIFEGVVSYKITRKTGVDKVTTIYAVDDVARKERKIENVSYSENTKASYILRDLVDKVGLPVAVFKTARDHTYKQAVTLDAELMSSITRYAKVCGVSAYVCKRTIYVRPITDGDDIHFNVTYETGLIESEPFEEESTHEDYVDTVKGLSLSMLLCHRIQTASVIQVTAINDKGVYRVREGSHSYDGSQMITTVKAV